LDNIVFPDGPFPEIRQWARRLCAVARLFIRRRRVNSVSPLSEVRAA